MAEKIGLRHRGINGVDDGPGMGAVGGVDSGTAKETDGDTDSDVIDFRGMRKAAPAAKNLRLRVPEDLLTRIDAIVDDIGVSRHSWLITKIGEAVREAESRR